MKINGNLVIAEGGIVKNLTLPSGTDFPANANLAEKFTLTADIDVDHPAGEYHHDGVAWQNLPTLSELQALIAEGGSASTYFKLIFTALTSQPTVAAGTYWFDSAQAISVTAGLPSTAPLTNMRIDPADYPTGSKLRISVCANVNAASTAASFVVSLRKVNRPASNGGAADQVVYSMDTTALGSVSIPSASLVAQASLHYYSAEFDMPESAGSYAFVFVQTGSMSSNSCIQFIATLQAKY